MRRLVLHSNWQAIGKANGTIPSNPIALQSEINNLYSFEDRHDTYHFKNVDYPHIANKNWVNPDNKGGSVPKECVRTIVTVL